MQNISSHDILIPFEPAIMTDQVKRQLKNQRYENEERRLLHHFLDKDSRVLELGAGIGFLSSFMHKKIKVAHVTCCEANPVLVDLIKKVHALNNLKDINVVHAVAVPDDAPAGPGYDKKFFVTNPFSASSLVKPHDTKKITDVIDVPTRRLSDLISESKATSIICDIEGGETDVFKTVRFGDVKTILMEVHTHRVGGKGTMRVFDSMHRHGFYYDQNISRGKVVLFRRLKKYAK